MYTVTDIAKKILWIDRQKKQLFLPDESSCDRLMNYLLMLQVHWLAKTRKYLFNETIQATVNGAYIPEIGKNYYNLEKERKNILLEKEISKFIDRFYYDMDESSNERTAELAKKDPAFEKAYTTDTDEYKELNFKEFEPYYPTLYEHTINGMV